MRVEDIYVGKLKTLKRGFSAFNQMFTRNTEVVDLVSWSWKVRIVAAPIDLRFVSA
jgi:hypothetical protein